MCADREWDFLSSGLVCVGCVWIKRDVLLDGNNEAGSYSIMFSESYNPER